MSNKYIKRIEKFKEREKKIFVVYYKQRWDVVHLIKAFKTEKEAKSLVETLEAETTVYDDTYTYEIIDKP